jgi:hypothetical protein
MHAYLRHIRTDLLHAHNISPKITKRLIQMPNIKNNTLKSNHIWSSHTPHHTTPHHITSHHITSYICTILYHIIQCINVSMSHIISYHIISYHILSYLIISYHILSYLIISYHIISLHTKKTKKMHNHNHSSHCSHWLTGLLRPPMATCCRPSTLKGRACEHRARDPDTDTRLKTVWPIILSYCEKWIKKWSSERGDY